MKPDVPEVLMELSGLVARNAAPDIPPADRAGALGLSAALLAFAASAWNDTAHNLVAENRQIRNLLKLTGEDSDLRIPALAEENARLRRLLIDRHAEIEGQDQQLEDAIWRELVESTRRRMVPGSPV